MTFLYSKFSLFPYKIQGTEKELYQTGRGMTMILVKNSLCVFIL